MVKNQSKYFKNKYHNIILIIPVQASELLKDEIEDFQRNSGDANFLVHSGLPTSLDDFRIDFKKEQTLLLFEDVHSEICDSKFVAKLLTFTGKRTGVSCIITVILPSVIHF